MNIYFHIGAGKCASSSIQRYFFKNQSHGDFTYANLQTDGCLLFGSWQGKASSQFFRNPINKKFLDNFERTLEECSKHYNNVLISHESLHARPKLFEQMGEILSKHNVYIIFIVRPPVEWVVSAWWQWKVWQEKYNQDVRQWLESDYQPASWWKVYKNFQQLSFVKNIYVFSLQRTIVEQVCNLLGVPYKRKNVIVANESSSAELLRFLQMRPALRPGPHDIEHERIINKYITKKNKGVWVLDASDVALILELTRPPSLKLAKYISNENIIENKAWWDVDYYADKIATCDKNYQLPYETLADMLEESYKIIVELDKKNRELNESIKQSQACTNGNKIIKFFQFMHNTALKLLSRR